MLFLIEPLEKAFVKSTQYTTKSGKVVNRKAYTDKRIAKTHTASDKVRATWKGSESFGAATKRHEDKHKALIEDAKETIKHHEALEKAKKKGKSHSEHGIRVDQHHHVIKHLHNLHQKLEDSAQRVMLHKNRQSLGIMKREEGRNKDKVKPKNKTEKAEAYKKGTRSQSLKGNKNAFKGGTKEEPRKVVAKSVDETKQILKENNDKLGRNGTNGRSSRGDERNIGSSDGGLQPYKKDGIYVARAELSKGLKSPKNYLSSDIFEKLRDHQKDGVNHIISQYESGQKGVILADSTGGGKTISQLSLAKYQADKGKSVLIVTKSKDIIKNAFQKDSKLIDGVELVHIQKTSDLEKAEPGKTYITTYNRLGQFSEAVKSRANKFDQVILDEAHSLKNSTSSQTKHGKEIINKADNVLLGTATLMDKGEHAGYIAAGLGLSSKAVIGDLGYEWGKYGYELKSGVSKKDAALRIGSFFDQLTEKGLMIKREVSMDNVDYKPTETTLGKADLEKYEADERAMDKLIDNAPARSRGIVTATEKLKLRSKLENYKIPQTIDETLKKIKEGKKVVIFATRVNASEDKNGQLIAGSTTDKLERILKEKGIKTATLTGNTKNGEEEIDRFNNGDAQVIITTPGKGGTGINLDDTTGKSPRAMVVMTPPFSANEVVQMFGRINRLTTKSKADISMMFTNTNIDNWNKNLISSKLSILGASVAGDYSKIDLEKFSGMSDDEILNSVGSKDIQVPVQTEQIKFNSIEKVSKVTPKSEAGKITTLKRFDDYIAHIPKKDGKYDYSKPWPDPTFGFGKHKGENISKHGDYLSWLIDSNGYNIILKDVSFAGESGKVNKASVAEWVPVKVSFDDKDKFKRNYSGAYKWTNGSWHVKGDRLDEFKADPMFKAFVFRI